MIRIYLSLCLGLLSNVLLAQTLPATEIYLFDLSVKKSKVTISHPVNITNRKGYDNQPFFHPDKPFIYYTSANDSARTDIRCYDYKTKRDWAITQTKENEYSPNVTLDKQYVSCIIQHDDGRQDLGKYHIEGGEVTIIIDNMKVGYHVWADNSHLGLFILGTPNTLHYLRLPTKKDTVVAQNIGRSLVRVPGESSISYVHKMSDNEWRIKKLETQSMKISDLGMAVTGHEDFTWLPEGKIIMSDGPKLYFLEPAKDPGWNEVIVSSGANVLKGVTRLAVSPDGKKLAVVVSE